MIALKMHQPEEHMTQGNESPYTGKDYCSSPAQDAGEPKFNLENFLFVELEATVRKCGEAVETAKHVIFDCPALCRRRSSYLEVVQEEGRQLTVRGGVLYLLDIGFRRRLSNHHITYT
nr:unnamed protein product [Callosobruchus chinensis]